MKIEISELIVGKTEKKVILCQKEVSKREE
jgi:hypothetical protein